MALGKLQRRNYRTPQPAVFLHRDGVINRAIGGIFDLSDLELLPGAADAIARLNATGIPAILLTSQSRDSERIHAKIDELLGRKGAYLDDLYCCKHHPENSSPREVVEKKVTSDCRKLAEVVLRQAAQEHVLSLERSIIIGNRDVEIEAGRSAGCITIHVPTNLSPADAAPIIEADRQALTLEEAVEIALSELGCLVIAP